MAKIRPQTEPPPPANDLPARPAPHGRLIVAPGTPIEQCPTSLDLATEEGRTLAFNALATPDLELGDRDEMEVPVSHYIAHPASQIDEETGEVREYSRLVLITPMGTTFATASEVSAHRFAQAFGLYESPPWHPPLRVVIRRVRSKRGRTYHQVYLRPREPKGVSDAAER
jgi:hypothetical protein